MKGSIPLEKALIYRERAFEWLESFPLGFNRDNVNTWKNEHLPVHVKGGMFHSYGFCKSYALVRALLTERRSRSSRESATSRQLVS